ncbi:MAG TPA: bifunctional folylpolyglutamate synthase/dihydrofolate synthase [Desulfuromonadales bacterium]|nr:bifunctional folylpolyglutamate synthase/dihydrofolate synthase [Desulfuromonadales bacterium]
MPLAALLEKLYARRRFGIRPGVDRVAVLLARLGNPERTFRSIHVVGTNGKGSTAAFLTSILSCSGLRTAQFSSPHLIRFTERFRINGSEYPADKLAVILKTVLEAAPEEATFFEITTALSCAVFCEERVEIAVVEAGMGGVSDATAALAAEMTIVTPIALDHAEYLGETLVEIAREKAAIIEPRTPVISAAQSDEVLLQIQQQCRVGGNLLRVFGPDFSADWNQQSGLDYRGSSRAFGNLKPGIPGRYQSQNAAVALAAAEQLIAHGTHISEAACVNGIATAHWPGRMELIAGAPPLLLDGAHNPAGAAALAEALADYAPARILLVTGACADKDIRTIYVPILPLVAQIYTVSPAVERALDDTALSRIFSDMGRASRCCGAVVSGIQTARADSRPGDLILVCGSLFLVGEVKAWLENSDYNGIRG